MKNGDELSRCLNIICLLYCKDKHLAQLTKATLLTTHLMHNEIIRFRALFPFKGLFVALIHVNVVTRSEFFPFRTNCQEELSFVLFITLTNGKILLYIFTSVVIITRVTRFRTH